MSNITLFDWLVMNYGEVASGRWDNHELDSGFFLEIPYAQVTHWQPLRQREQLLEYCKGSLNQLMTMTHGEHFTFSVELSAESPSDYMRVGKDTCSGELSIPKYPYQHGRAIDLPGKPTKQLNILIFRQDATQFRVMASYYGDVLDQEHIDEYVRCLGEPMQQ